MTWTDEQQGEAEWRLQDKGISGVLDYAAELLRGGGGEMTDAVACVEEALRDLYGYGHRREAANGTAVQWRAQVALSSITGLFAAQGAEVATLREKVAGLEADLANKDAAYAELESDASQVREEMDVARAELARLRPSGQVAEDVKTLQMAWWADCEKDCEENCDGTTTHTDTCEVWGYEQALSRLAALAQQGQATQRLTCPEGHARLKDAAQVDEGCLRCQVETLRTEVRRRDAALATHARLGHPATPEAAPHTHEWVAPAVGTQVCTGCPERRYPCSERCAHLDAASPDHAERVAERSQAFNEVSGPNVGHPDALPEGPLEVVDPAFIAGHEQGAEAMRAACWEAVQAEMQRMGVFDVGVRARLKAAIEGAAL
jgi:hypothetical protein